MACALAAKDQREPCLKFLLGEELLGGQRPRGREIVDIAVEQKLGRIHEHLGGRFSSVDRDEFDSGTLLVVEVDFHVLRLCFGDIRLSTELW